MTDARKLLEAMAAMEFDEGVQLTLALAAHEILQNLDEGKKPGADVALGLANRKHRPRSSELAERDFEICYRLAQAKQAGDKLTAVVTELAQELGLSESTITDIAKRDRRRVSAGYWDRFIEANELQAEIAAHYSVFVGLSLTDTDREEIGAFAAYWAGGQK